MYYKYLHVVNYISDVTSLLSVKFGWCLKLLMFYYVGLYIILGLMF